ncbi:MAG: AzlC family ABC transporter permease [Dongiaceae bacterium]
MTPRVFTADGFRRGFVAALPFILSNGLAGMVMAVAYKGVGLGAVPAVAFSVVVYSATAQAVTLGLWAVPPPIAAMVAAAVATNARYLVMGAHLRRLFRRAPFRLMLPILFLLGDAAWLMTATDAERRGPDAGYLLGCSLPMAIGWIGGTALGCVLPFRPEGALAAAAALLPLLFVATLLPSRWRGRRSLPPWALSAAAAVVVLPFTGQGWAMLIGGGLGTLFCALRGDRD